MVNGAEVWIYKMWVLCLVNIDGIGCYIGLLLKCLLDYNKERHFLK